jgi:aminopeptidase N
MQEDNGSNIKKFELPGSKAHYAPSLSFTISHMQLSIEPDFKSKTISCEQQLEVIAIQSIDEIILDICELHIKSVSSVDIDVAIAANDSDSNNHIKELNFRNYGDKLIIKLDRMLSEETFFVSLLYIQQSRERVFILSNLMNTIQRKIYKLGLKAKQLSQNTGFHVSIIHWSNLKAKFQL